MIRIFLNEQKGNLLIYGSPLNLFLLHLHIFTCRRSHRRAHIASRFKPWAGGFWANCWLELVIDLLDCKVIHQFRQNVGEGWFTRCITQSLDWEWWRRRQEKEKAEKKDKKDVKHADEKKQADEKKNAEEKKTIPRIHEAWNDKICPKEGQAEWKFI